MEATSTSADTPASPSRASRSSVLSAQSPNSPKRRGRAKRPPPRPPRGGRRSPSNDTATENCPPRDAGGCLPRVTRRNGGRRSQSSGTSAKQARAPPAKSNRAVDSKGRATERGRDDAAPAAVREGIHEGKNERYRSVRAGKRRGEDAGSVAGGVDDGDAPEKNGGVPNAGGGRKRTRRVGGGRKRNDDVEDTNAGSASTHQSDAGLDETPLPDGYVPPAPPTVETVDEAVRQMLGLLGFHDAIKNARSEEEKQHALNLRAVLEKHLRQAFAEGTYDDIFTDLRPLVWGRGPGLYALLFNINALLKVGMSSRDRMVRAKEQWHKLAFDLCGMDELNKLIPDDSEVVQAILKLMPPGLQFHPDKRRQLLDIVKMQIAELMVASLYKMSTGTAGERLMQWPRESVQKLTTLRPAESYSADDIAWFTGDLDFFLTWSTYKSNLLKRRAREEVLRRLLPDHSKGVFLQLYMTMCAFDLDQVPDFENALEDSVRSEEMRGVIADLERLLDLAAKELSEHGTISLETAQRIRDVVATINRDSDNYKHYKAPETQRLVEAAVPKLRAKINASQGKIIVWERTLYNDIKNSDPKAFDELIPPGSTDFVEMVEGEEHLLRVTSTMPDGKVVKHLITCSLFCIFAEEKNLATRKSVLKAYMELLSYQLAAGRITREHAEREAAIMRSFLMELEGFKGNIDDDEVDGSFRAARNHHVGEGIAVGGIPRNVRSLSVFLGIGYLELLDIYSSLSREQFHAFLNAFGVKAGRDNLTPLDADFSCPGVEAVADLAARPCPHDGCDEADRPYVELAGKDIADFSLELKFRCHTCACTARDREKIKIEQRIASQDATVTGAQRQRAEERKGVLEQRNETQRAKYQAGRVLVQRRATDGDDALSPDELERAKKIEDERQRKNETQRAKYQAGRVLVQRRATEGDEALSPDELEQAKKVEDQRQRNEDQRRKENEANQADEMWLKDGYSSTEASKRGFPTGYGIKKGPLRLRDPSGNIFYGAKGIKAKLKEIEAIAEIEADEDGRGEGKAGEDELSTVLKSAADFYQEYAVQATQFKREKIQEFQDKFAAEVLGPIRAEMGQWEDAKEGNEKGIEDLKQLREEAQRRGWTQFLSHDALESEQAKLEKQLEAAKCNILDRTALLKEKEGEYAKRAEGLIDELGKTLRL